MDLITRRQARDVLTDRRRLLPALLAFVGYAFAGVTVPMMLLFAGGWWLPKTVDAGPHLSTGPSVVIDLLLVALFGLQHSGMARGRFKAFITRWVPEALERTVYVVAASVAVWVLCLGWQPLPQRIWSSTGIPRDRARRRVLARLRAGLRGHPVAEPLPPTRFQSGLPRPTCAACPDVISDRLQVQGPYRLVRHPLMTGLLLCFWCASTFTAGHLLWAASLTGYILLGTALEERDLIARFGAAYRSYAARVPAFFPSPLQGCRQGAARMNQTRTSRDRSSRRAAWRRPLRSSAAGSPVSAWRSSCANGAVTTF